MKNFLVLIFLLFCAVGYAQVKPNEFTEETEPNNTNFELYSQFGGINKKASLYNLKRYYSPDVNPTPIAGIPTLTGNVSYLMQVVTDSIGDIWYIDSEGEAKKLNDIGSSGSVDWTNITSKPAGFADDIDDVDDADNSVTNEIQTIDTFSISNDTITLSLSSDAQPAKTIVLPPGSVGGSIISYDAGSGATVWATGAGVTFLKPVAGEYEFTVPTGVELLKAVVEGNNSDADVGGDLYVEVITVGGLAYNNDIGDVQVPSVRVWDRSAGTVSRVARRQIFYNFVVEVTKAVTGSSEIVANNVNATVPLPAFEFNWQ